MADVLTPKVRSVENMVQRARNATRKTSALRRFHTVDIRVAEAGAGTLA